MCGVCPQIITKLLQEGLFIPQTRFPYRSIREAVMRENVRTTHLCLNIIFTGACKRNLMGFLAVLNVLQAAGTYNAWVQVS